MKKYLAFDGINGGHEDFDTIEEARKWLEDCFLSPDEGYHPDFASCKIYQLAETVECEVVDKKENYKYIYEDDIPEGDNESQAWPYSTDFDEIWKHKFVSETDQKTADKMVSERYPEKFIRWITASEVILFNGRWNVLNMESMTTQELYRYWVGLQNEKQRIDEIIY